jgi:hypothetical protein
MKPTRFRPLLCFSLVLALVSQVGAQVTYSDNFSTSVNYQTNGIAGTIWDGLYLGPGDFANPTSVTVTTVTPPSLARGPLAITSISFCQWLFSASKP